MFFRNRINFSPNRFAGCPLFLILPPPLHVRKSIFYQIFCSFYVHLVQWFAEIYGHNSERHQKSSSFFQESREIRYRFHGPPILREPSKAPCRGRPAFWPGSSLQKAILLPTGCVCFEQEKRGPVYPHLVQLTLEDFSAFSIIIVTGTKAFRKGKVCPCGALFLFCQNAEGAAPVRILDKDGKVYGKLYRAEKHPWSVRSTV